MKLKEREESNASQKIRGLLKFIHKSLLFKIARRTFWIIFILGFFIFGILIGLTLTGFFGTLDEPSQKVLGFLHERGFTGTELREMKIKVEGILKENVKIPFHFIQGKISKPEKIYIDVAFEDYQKIEYKRQEAIERGLLITSGEDYVPANIRHKDKEYNVRLRLKGDMVDHLVGDKWSFRIKVKNGETLFGMTTFSIQNPSTKDYLYEWVFHKALKREGVMSLRYDFIEVIVNGENKGIYALEEHFEKELIEDNNKREGVIIKFNEDLMWAESSDIIHAPDFFYASEIETFDDEDVLEDESLSKQFKEAKSLLESFRRGSLETHEVFEIDVLARYFAINTVLSSSHSSKWHNIRFYYNPITSKLEPIGFDGNSARTDANSVMAEYFAGTLYKGEAAPLFEELIFMDEVFFEKYMGELERVSQKEYLDELFGELSEDLKEKTKIIYKDNFLYYFSSDIYYRNSAQIQERLNPLKSMNVYLEKIEGNKINILAGNIDSLPLEVKNVLYNDSIIFELNQEENIIKSKKTEGAVRYQKFEFAVPENMDIEEEVVPNLKINYKIFGTETLKSEKIFPYGYIEENFSDEDFIRNKSNLSLFEFLDVDDFQKTIYFKEGYWKLNQSLILPKGFSVFCKAGTKIDLVYGASILSYSPVYFSGGSENPIEIISSDKTGQGFSVLNAKEKSLLENVIFSDLTNPIKKGWELTGAITFYESPIEMKGVLIKNMHSEDSLDIIRSEYEIKNSFFENCFSDCLDDDFGEGFIENTKFVNCGNDCVDFSGSKTEIRNLEIFNAGDKGISVGEESNLTIENLKIFGDKRIHIGIASKDLSFVFINNSKISNTKYSVAVYQKKPEFGASLIEIKNTTFTDFEKMHIVEKKSNLLIDDTIVLGTAENVYIYLYGEEK